MSLSKLRFKNLSIRRKQMLIIMLTTSIALLLASVALIAFDIVGFRTELVEQAATTAEMVGNNCVASLDFDDPQSAGEILAALRAESSIRAACIYDRTGDLFSMFIRNGDKTIKQLPPAGRQGYQFLGNTLWLFKPIVVNGESVGSVGLAYNLQELYSRILRFAATVVSVLLVSLLVAFIISVRLQELVSSPIRQLAQMTRAVAVDKNYSIRAVRQSRDELGELIDGFNEMLAQIQQRDLELQNARDTLERRVQERTAKLAESLSLLNATLESTTDGILAMDLDGKVTSINSKFAAIWNFPPDVLHRRDSAEMIAFSAQQVTDPDRFLSLAGQLHEVNGRQLLDIFELKDGRFFERYALPQHVNDRRVGAVINWRDITERKRAERALQESQALYHSLVEQLPVGVFRKDVEGRYVFVNSTFCSMKGLSADKFLGKSPIGTKESLSKEMGGEAEAMRIVGPAITHHQEIMRTGRQIIIEEHYTDVQGVEHYRHVVKSPVFGADGAIIGSQGILMDITERKLAEAALRESQALYHSLVEHLPVGVFRKDREGRFVFVNSWFCRLKGVDATEFLNKTPREVRDRLSGKAESLEISHQLSHLGISHHEQILATGRQLETEECYPDSEGHNQYLYVVKSPVFGANGSIIGSQGILMDITARKQAEMALAYERYLLHALLDSAPDRIYFKDLHSRFIRCSKSHARAFNLENPENVIGKTDFDFFKAEHAQSAFEDEQNIIRTGQSLVGAVEHELWNDGRNTWALTNKMPLRDIHGNIIGTLGISKDISELKHAEEEREKLNRQLLEISRQAGMAEVASNVLHNVGNVLNSVNVSATLVADSARKSKVASLAKVVGLLDEHEHDLGAFLAHDSKGRQVHAFLRKLSEHLSQEQEVAIAELESLRKNIEHIKDIVSMQQSYAKMSGLKEMVMVADLVEDSLRMNEGALQRHEVKVVRDYQQVPAINVEKHKVLQILVNLVRNAKYACDDSGKVEKQITIRIRNGSEQVQVSVSDNGIGIPPENLNRIFNHGFTTRKNGHGFGLHSGALAAREMGGTLQAHSEGIGCGATFTLLLPLSPPANETLNDQNFASPKKKIATTPGGRRWRTATGHAQPSTFTRESI